MQLLLDECLPKDLLRDFAAHTVKHVKGSEYEGLQNGELLAEAQHKYDVLITVDVNLYQQNKVFQFNLAVVVLRAYLNAYESLIDTVPAALEVLQMIQGRLFMFGQTSDCAKVIAEKVRDCLEPSNFISTCVRDFNQWR